MIWSFDPVVIYIYIYIYIYILTDLLKQLNKTHIFFYLLTDLKQLNKTHIFIYLLTDLLKQLNKTHIFFLSFNVQHETEHLQCKSIPYPWLKFCFIKSQKSVDKYNSMCNCNFHENTFWSTNASKGVISWIQIQDWLVTAENTVKSPPYHKEMVYTPMIWK